MTFGEIIRKLRRDADLTQERLAEILSISPQAVSRWETDMAMPDVSLLPALANLFDVTTDYLLGVDLTKKRENIYKIQERANGEFDLRTEEAWERGIQILRDGLKLYPENPDLKHTLALRLLCTHRIDKEARKQDYLEMNRICEELLASPDVEGYYRRSAIQYICDAAWVTENQERAAELARTADGMSYSREVLLCKCLDGEKGTDARKELIRSCVMHLYLALSSFILRPVEGVTGEDILYYYEKAKKLYELIYDNDDYAFDRAHADDYLFARALARTGDLDDAFDLLNGMIDRMETSMNDKTWNLSRLFPEKEVILQKSEPWDVFAGAGEYLKLIEEFPEEAKADPRFAEILAKLSDLHQKYSTNK